MIALKTIDLRNDFKRVSEIALSGESVLIARPHNRNLVVLGEAEYNDLLETRKNFEYIAKLEKSSRQLAEGKTVTKTFTELEAMAK